MRKSLSSVLFICLLAAVASAEFVVFQRVGDMVKRADLIARVTIVSVRATGAQDGYGKVARAHSVEAFRGVEAGEFFDLEFEPVSGGVPFVCPTINYTEGEDVLLFAERLPGGGYHTLLYSAGKFLIKDGRVNQTPFAKAQPYREAAAEVRRELKKVAQSEKARN